MAELVRQRDLGDGHLNDHLPGGLIKPVQDVLDGTPALGIAFESVTRLLPRLRNAEETEVVIVTLPEATPFYEADRLKEDLERAEIAQKWWVINASLLAAEPEDKFLKSRAAGEERWIRQIEKTAGGNAVLVPWTA